MHTYWRQEIYIYGIATDVKKLVTEKGDSRFSNAHLRGIVKQAILHEGIHIAKGDMDFPERLLPAISRPAIHCLEWQLGMLHSQREPCWSGHLTAFLKRADSVRRMDKWNVVEMPAAATGDLLDCPALFTYDWDQTIGWLGSDQLIWLILVDDMSTLLDPPDDDPCPIQVPLLVSSNAHQGNDWLPVHNRCTGHWTFS